MDQLHTLAIDIGGTKFSMAVFEGQRIIERISRPTDRAGGRTWMVDQILQIATDWQQQYAFVGCGIGFGGPVDYPAQIVVCSTHVPSWDNFPFSDYLGERLHLPVRMDNDANVGALGEAVHGAGVGANPLLYLTLSTGIGGGIVLDGNVLHGADSFGGEIGHLTVQPDGPACLCGSNGCLERMCCGLWLERDYGQSAQMLLQDPEFVERYVVDLARGIKAGIMLLNPERVVIGGGMIKAGDKLFVPLREELRRQIPAWSRARIEVVPAALGDDSVLYGALVLAQSAERRD